MAKLMMFRFIKNGLLDGQYGIYVSDENPADSVIGMLKFGIPVQYFENKKMHVYHVCNRCAYSEEFCENTKRDLINILSKMNLPYRVVGRLIPSIDTKKGMALEMELEKATHENFDDFDGSIMCPYDVSKIEQSRKEKWLQELKENHHDVIYVPNLGHGRVLSKEYLLKVISNTDKS
jgi:hypothetical protein